MKPQYRFFVVSYVGSVDFINDNIQKDCNEFLSIYDDVNVQSMVKDGHLAATVIYKVILKETDEFQDW